MSLTFKDTNITNPGTSIKYGADDMELIARLFNGVTTGIPAVTIKSTNKWGFWDNVLFIRNQADTQNMTIRGPAVMTSSLDLALPSITTNDSLAATGMTNVWGVKQQFEAGVLIKQSSTPSNPASTYHHLYVNTSGQLIKRDSSGTEIQFTSSLSTGDVSSLRDYSARVFNSGGTYYAYNSSGALLTSGTTFETVAQAALNAGGSVLFSGPTTLTCSASFAGLDIMSASHLIVERGCTITVPNAYTGHFLRALNKDRFIIEVFGSINEAGTPVRNWTCFFLDSTTTPIMASHILHAHVFNASTVLRLRATGATAFIMNNSFGHIFASDCRKTVLFEEVTSGSIDSNMFMEIMMDALTAVTTDGFKDITGSMNEFHGCMFMDNSGTMNEANILSSADNTMIIGGNIGQLGGSTFTDNSLTTMYFTTGAGLKIDSGFLRVRTPSGAKVTNIANAEQTVDRIVTIPLVTANCNFVVTGADNVLGSHYLDVTNIATPANPSAGTRRIFFDITSGKLSVRTSTGTTVSLEEQGGGGGGGGTGDMLLAGVQTVTAAKTFLDQTLKFFNPAQTFAYTVATSAISTADKVITLPLLTANANFVFDSFPNVFSAAQKNDNYIDLKAITEPSSPGSGYVRYFIDSINGKFSAKHSNGDVTVFE